MKKLLLSLLSVGLLSFAAANLSAQDEPKKKGKKKADSGEMSSTTAPKTMIHVVTVTFKEDATPQQIKAALDGVHKMAAAYPGMTRVWTKTYKAQGDHKHAFVMEFKDEQAFKDYTDSDAQKEWYKVYLPIRAASTTFDITN